MKERLEKIRLEQKTKKALKQQELLDKQNSMLVKATSCRVYEQ